MTNEHKDGWKPSLTSKCAVCNERRAEVNLNSVTGHTGQYYDMSPEAMSQTLRFCKDSTKCREVAGAMVRLKMPYDHPECWRAEQKKLDGR